MAKGASHRPFHSETKRDGALYVGVGDKWEREGMDVVLSKEKVNLSNKRGK